MIVTSIVLVILVIGAVYYYINDSPYETAVVGTTSTNGVITTIENASVSLGGSSSNTSPNARLTISTSYGTFNAFISCWPTQYKVGQNTTVTVQTLRNGNHSFAAPNLVCRGQFQSTTTTKSTTAKSSSH